jgi:hypothetical protein
MEKRDSQRLELTFDELLCEMGMTVMITCCAEVLILRTPAQSQELVEKSRNFRQWSATYPSGAKALLIFRLWRHD